MEKIKIVFQSDERLDLHQIGVKKGKIDIIDGIDTIDGIDSIDIIDNSI